ncbi:MAG: Lrp/AsnC family transcriptional regulator [Ideonella sp.]|nr:Lrp/AsnC family transcriptional regulator [Ideonella sp.]
MHRPQNDDRPLHPADELRLALMNDWQHDFPLVREPFAAIAEALHLDVSQVMHAYRTMQASGSLSRIGGVFGAGTGGAGLLAAMAVPPERLDAVAAIVSAHPGVNHNYERENQHNLWFVMNGPDDEAVAQAMHELEAATGLPALQMRMQRAYRIDLGFDMRRASATRARAHAGRRPQPAHPAPVSDAQWPLAALVEDGLPLIERPFDAWAQALGSSAEAVIASLQQWLQLGTLRRFGAVVRHHEFGFCANAMTVFDVPDGLVDACGAALAREAGVTLAYRRERAPGWPYNLYCMVHGRDRSSVRQLLDELILRCSLDAHPRAVLFSRRRFKQTGARRFRAASVPGAGTTPEMLHVAA